MQLEREAGFWIRLGAALLDGIIIGVPLYVLSLIISGDTNRDVWTDILSALYSLLVPVFWNGYTIGKRICGIRIRKIDDFMPPTLWTMIKRNIIAGLVYGLTCGIAVIVSAVMVGVREDKRSIHDFIAGTEVVHD
ncbi:MULTISPECIES: RDD family protein [Paenibacillus]|uniref:RDD family protein n=1 Tax=Paenibacillus TaxID=44249 RepID=UPI00203ADA87|nr:RDD family protein [Paenibacillus camelliae]MCM3634862.1 RDD family protein [Paenibacillus camelliae]